MGGVTFYEEVYAGTPKEAFECAVAEATYEYGHGPYSGTIKEKGSFEVLTLPRGKNPYDFANEMMDKNDKWGPAFCLLLEEGNQVVEETIPTGSKVDIIPNRVTRKWETRYVVRVPEKTVNSFGLYDCTEKEHSSHTTQAAAIRAARAYSEKHNAKSFIDIEKRLVNAPSRIGEVEPKQKISRKKVSHNKYLFFGIASS